MAILRTQSMALRSYWKTIRAVLSCNTSFWVSVLFRPDGMILTRFFKILAMVFQFSFSFYAIIGWVATYWLLIKLRWRLSTSLSLLLLLLLLLLLWLLGEFADHHVTLSKDGIALGDHLILLEFYNLLLVRLREVVLSRWVWANRDSILLHWLHAVSPWVASHRVTCHRGLTAANNSLLTLHILERSSCTYLTRSILLTAARSHGLLPWLVLIDLIEWWHRSLTLCVIVILAQKTIQILRSRAWPRVLVAYSLHFTILVGEFSPRSWLLSAASSSWL